MWNGVERGVEEMWFVRGKSLVSGRCSDLERKDIRIVWEGIEKRGRESYLVCVWEINYLCWVCV